MLNREAVFVEGMLNGMVGYGEKNEFHVMIGVKMFVVYN